MFLDPMEVYFLITNAIQVLNEKFAQNNFVEETVLISLWS